MARDLFKKAYWPLVALGASYFVILGLLMVPWIQNNAIYMHRMKVLWRQNLTKPEEFGFAKNQVTPFFLKTPDGEDIFAWHVLPLGLYKEHRESLVKQKTGLITNPLESENIKLLIADPEARLIIHCVCPFKHSLYSNAGTLGTSCRPTYLRSLSAGDPSKIHIIALDYRGFGLSSGTPSEQGLITDGITAVKWAVNTLGISPSRIAAVGQSLGTAVAIGTAEKLATHPISPIELGAVITIAGFSNMKELILTYNIFGWLPILSPLRPYPFLQRFFTKFIIDTWESDKRIVSLIKSSKKLNFIVLHAYNDFDIPWQHSDRLFVTAANATQSGNEQLTWLEIMGLKEKTEFGEESYQNKWPTDRSNGHSIEQWVVRWGGHNQVVASAGTSVIVAKALGL
ncbi:alpha/beta-hydrolase [Choiromyces venosus 120613-1]|uniref:Alpha/beta-hydrolase n=1 Tax=Choiromyces venosus 120613-1 TaxID=1336337 RepID=A0A3N4J2K6_9PEZI|nr:alpha/beta-hydrolase [Choiromyces venosus 120613-1]